MLALAASSMPRAWEMPDLSLQPAMALLSSFPSCMRATMTQRCSSGYVTLLCGIGLKWLAGGRSAQQRHRRSNLRTAWQQLKMDSNGYVSMRRSRLCVNVWLELMTLTSIQLFSCMLHVGKDEGHANGVWVKSKDARLDVRAEHEVAIGR